MTLSLDRYSRFEEDRILLNPFWGFGEQSYPYSAVEAVVLTSHVRTKGRETEHTRFFILFADGRQWCNEDYGPPVASVLEDAALADFACEKSGHSLRRVRHIEEVTGRVGAPPRGALNTALEQVVQPLDATRSIDVRRHDCTLFFPVLRNDRFME